MARKLRVEKQVDLFAGLEVTPHQRVVLDALVPADRPEVVPLVRAEMRGETAHMTIVDDPLVEAAERPLGTRVPSGVRVEVEASERAEEVARDVVRAARAALLRRVFVRRGAWGIQRFSGRWQQTGDCLCAAAAWLVEEKVPAAAGESPVAALARAWGVLDSCALAFVNGFDGVGTWSGSPREDAWRAAGEVAAVELGLVPGRSVPGGK